MAATYAESVIDITIQLGQGSFGGAGSDRVTFRGLRTMVDIELAVQAPPVALVRVFGLSLSRVNQLTRAGINWEASENTILIQAGDAGGQLKSLYEGLIFIASPEYNSMPETSFVIFANSGRVAQLKPVAPN